MFHLLPFLPFRLRPENTSLAAIPAKLARAMIITVDHHRTAQAGTSSDGSDKGDTCCFDLQIAKVL